MWIMPNAHYEQGRRFEWKVIADLAFHAWVTLRAAGSKGAGKVDIVAVREPGLASDPYSAAYPFNLQGEHLWVQCKRTGDIPLGEWNRLVECAGWAGAVPVLAENGERGRGVTYWQITGPRTKGMRRADWPRRLYDIRASTSLEETTDEGH